MKLDPPTIMCLLPIPGMTPSPGCRHAASFLWRAGKPKGSGFPAFDAWNQITVGLGSALRVDKASQTSPLQLGRKPAETLTFSLSSVKLLCLNGCGYWPAWLAGIGLAGWSQATPAPWETIYAETR